MQASRRTADREIGGGHGGLPRRRGGTAMGLFEWIREGVRQAVVLGFADAVEDVGERTRDEDFGTALAQSLRARLAAPRGPAVLEAAAPATGRRRLVRSLDALRKAA